MADDISGRFEITRQLHKGDFSSTCLATDRQCRDAARIIQLPVNELSDPAFYAELARELSAIQSIEQAHILPIRTFGLEGDYFLIACDLPEGGTLTDQLALGTIPPEKAKQIITQVGTALDSVHARGIVHGDLKPGQIHFDAEGNALLSGFGAYPYQRAVHQGNPQVLIGPLGYLSPEQIHGHEIDRRADIYALGVLFHQMITGKLPYESDTVIGFATQHLVSPPRIEKSFPRNMQKGIQKALQKSPAKRYDAAAEFSAQINKKQRNFPAAAIWVGVVALAALLWFFFSDQRPILKTEPTPTVYAAVLDLGKTPDRAVEFTRTPAITEPAATPEEPQTTLSPTNTARATQTFTPEPPRTPIPTITSIYQETASAAINNYDVLLNDTLFDIASKLQTNLTNLLSYNNLSCDSRLYPELRNLSVPPPGSIKNTATDQRINSHNVSSLREFHTLECTQHVSDLAFSPSGEILAVASGPSIFLWRVSDWQPLYQIEEHLARITQIEFSPDGKQLASGAIDNSVRIWSLESNQLVKVLPHRNEITDLAYAPDGQQLTVTSLDQSAFVYAVSDWEKLHEFWGYQTISAAYAPDGKRLAVAYTDRVDLFDTQTFTLQQSLEPQTPGAPIGRHLVFSSNGLLLATSNHLWQISNGRAVYHWEGKTHRTFFTPDLEAFFIGPKIVQLRNGNTAQTLTASFEAATRSAYDFDSIALAPDQTQVVWGNLDGVFIFGLENDLPRPEEPFYLGSGDNFFNIARAQNVQLSALLGQNGLTCANIPYISQSLVIPAEKAPPPPQTPAFSTTNIEAITPLQDLDMACAIMPNGLQFSPERDYLVSGVDVWDMATGALLIRGPIPEQPSTPDETEPAEDAEDFKPVTAATTQISPDADDPTAAVLDGRQVQVWDLQTGKLRHILTGHEGRITDLIYSANGKIMITSSLDETTRLWRVENGEELDQMPGFTAEDMLMTPDDKFLISISGDTARFWALEISADGKTAAFLNQQTGRPQETLSGFEGVYRLSPDGKYFTTLACTEKSGSHCTAQYVSLLQIDTKFAEAHRLFGVKDLVQDFVFSTDSKLIAIVAENTIEIWDIEADPAIMIQRLVGDAKRAERIQEMHFTPDSSILITQVSNKMLRFWDVESGEILDEQKYAGVRTWTISADQRQIALLIDERILIMGVAP